MTFLEDDILKLRAVEPSDAEAMWEIETDSSQWMMCGMSGPYSRENLTQYAVTFNPDPWHEGQIRLIVEEKGKGICGIADLYDMSPINRTACVGIYILKGRRRRGLGLRAIEKLESYAANLLNVRILLAKVAEGNEESNPLFIKAGYTLRGTLPGWIQSGRNLYALNLYTKTLI